MTTHTEDTVKQSVRDRYAAIARSGDACCAPAPNGDDCCAPASVQFTSKAHATAIVAEADLGLSCGSPTVYGDIHPGDTVLDLGSGAGVDVFRAASLVGDTGRVIGVDMTADMVDLARSNAARGGYANTEFRLGEIEDLPIDDLSIDVILSNCVINLVPDKSQVFTEMYRVLAPGGRFIISDIVTTGEMPADLRDDLVAWAECVAGAIDRNDYLDLIESAGFADVEVVAEHDYDGTPTRSITVRATKP